MVCVNASALADGTVAAPVKRPRDENGRAEL